MNDSRSTLLRIALVLLAWLAVGMPSPSAARSLPEFSGLVERNAPTVVNISTTQSLPEELLSFPGFDESDPMFDWFRRFIPRMPDFPRFSPDDRSLGSGFIISSDGYILTNAHVVADAEEILVRLADKREYRADLIGADVRTDVALIKIEARGLPAVVLGDPHALKVGEWVLAIGSPFGFDHSVTAGIVSAKGRALPDENFVPFIQTDVAINPGNSGGPLFNLKGEVVGINSQIYSQTGGFMGLSFAIPIDVAMQVQSQLRERGRVERGRIGVSIQEVTKAIAESFGLPGTEGALVSAVEPDGPADRAGLMPGDIILGVDGRNVPGSVELPRIVARLQPGVTAALRILRNGEIRETAVVVGEWAEEGRISGRMPSKPAARANRLGLTLAPERPSARAPAQPLGLVVENVQGAAARGDVRKADVLLAIVIDGKQHRLDSVATFDRLAGGLREGQTISLLIRRAGATLYVSVRVGA
ncbi:MAG: Do family serine endopeptidase [Rhodocyclaceae bacterium]|nr:Do family serine endopeptidase [Rhodocyclaceae bacterium]